MAKYQSKHANLSFYVNGERKKFAGGVFKTEDKDVIKVLDKLKTAHRVKEDNEDAEPKQAQQKQSEAKPKAKKGEASE